MQLILNKVATQRHKVVGKHLTLDMVVLMLDDTSRLACKLLVVLHKVFVEVAHADGHRAAHILMQTRE